MYGSTGINVNVVFSLTLTFSLVISHWAQATIFYSNDVFSSAESALQEVSTSKSELPLTKEKQILVFIDPQCPWCRQALENLSRFKKRTPHWRVKVYVMATIKEFIDFFHQQMTTIPDNLDYTLDFKNALADTYIISRTPTYIIINNGKVKKVEGYVDLAHFAVDDHV